MYMEANCHLILCDCSQMEREKDDWSDLFWWSWRAAMEVYIYMWTTTDHPFCWFEPKLSYICIYIYMLHNWIASLMIWMPSEFGASQHLLGSSPNVLFFWKSKESGLNQLSSIVFFLAATPMRKNIPWPQFQPAATQASNEAHGIDDWRRGTDQEGRRMCHRHLSMLNLKSPESRLMWR